MKNKGKKLRAWVKPVRAAALILALSAAAGGAGAEPLYSEAWGFYLDLPVDYESVGGDGKDTFSFAAADGGMFDLKVYGPALRAGRSVEDLVLETVRRLGNLGETSAFTYRGRQAVFIGLSFSLPGASGSGRSSSVAYKGWGLCVELGAAEEGTRPALLALAYGPAAQAASLADRYLSALDSLAPEEADRRRCGPLTERSFSRGAAVERGLAGLDAAAWFYEGDAEAAQAVVDREYAVLEGCPSMALLPEAQARFYRVIYRDSFERLADAAFIIERNMNAPDFAAGATTTTAGRDEANRAFAAKALAWVQGFTYERDLAGSDFVNLVAAVQEGRGDCDSRALLWALILNQADIPAGIMVSTTYSHAMGFADLPGTGARFEQWLVAETTAPVAIGLIGQSMSSLTAWTGIRLDFF